MESLTKEQQIEEELKFLRHQNYLYSLKDDPSYRALMLDAMNRLIKAVENLQLDDQDEQDLDDEDDEDIEEDTPKRGRPAKVNG